VPVEYDSSGSSEGEDEASGDGSGSDAGGSSAPDDDGTESEDEGDDGYKKGAASLVLRLRERTSIRAPH